VPYPVTPYGPPDPPPVSGEIIDQRIADVEALARWMDYAFALPGGSRFGLAGFIGLIPGLGDLIDAAVSLYIVHRAVQLGIPRVAITRMIVNVGIEGVVGSVPFAGDAFDIAFKANRRNYQILRNHMRSSRRQSRLDWVFVLGTALLGTAAIILPILVIAQIVKHI
jgi:hypothetical protein